MTRLLKLLCFSLLIACNSAGFSQNFSAGFFSGVNISDIHGNSYTGKWKFKPGPVQGVFIDFYPGSIFGLSTGLNYSTLYYEHKSYLYTDQPVFYPYYSSSYIPEPWYLPGEVMDFSFITIPAEIKLTIPSKPSLTLSAGTFWSFIQGQNVNSYYSMSEIRKNDFGFIYSAGLAYPVSGDFDLLLRVRYLTGRKDFYENMHYRHGSIDFNLGVSFSGLFGKPGEAPVSDVRRDTSSGKLNLVYFAGTSFTWNTHGNSGGHYSNVFGPSAGFRIDIPIGTKSEFRTGLSFERAGYALKDSSDVFYGYNIKDDAEYFVNTRTSIDYVEIPATLKFNIGRFRKFYVLTGPYLAVKLNARTKGSAFSEQWNNTTFRVVKTEVYDDLERLIRDYDSGWMFGAGITVPVFGKYHAEAGLQYKTGFRDVFDMSSFSGTDQRENMKTVIRNRAICIYLGFRLPAGR